MNLIDTHAHLYLSQFNEDRQEMLDRAKKAGISSIFLPNIDSSSTEDMLDMCQKWPDICFPLMGIHPCSIKDNYKEELDHAHKWLEKGEFYGVGEVGLDYYWDKTHIEEQKDAFRKQISWSKDFKLPVIIHSRDSLHDSIKMISEEQDGSLEGIFHCFTGTADQAREIIGLGFYIGIGGVVTFKNSGLDKVLEQISPDKIVFETDAPYLSPVPFRGKRNESSYIPLMVEKLSGIYLMGEEEIAEIALANSRKVFTKAFAKSG